MGASKRLAELILQALARERGSPTMFTMVRFGNVLDSSGSVVRRFRSQIQQGGPVTVTHPEIIRYFMSIPEAAQLVIQAGAMAEGGEVFVLDMGTPVKIADLARTMVHLSGREVRDDSNPDGDIAIEFVGLRRGEKLYEELLIGENTTGTSHPRIFKTSEPILGYDDLAAALERLDDAIQKQDDAELQDMLRATVEGYTPAASAPRLRRRTNGSRSRARCIEAMPMTWPVLALGVVVAAAALTAGLILILKPLLVRFLLAQPNARSRIKWQRRKAPASPSCSPWSRSAALACLLSASLRGALRALCPCLPPPQRSPCSARSTTPTRSRPCGASSARPLPPSSWWRACRSDLRLLPGLLPLMVERALLVLGTVGLHQCRQLPRRHRLDDGGRGRPHHPGVAVLEALGAVPARIGLLALALLGAMLGFALFNKHPAQVFLGDAGSLPIGLCLAFLLDLRRAGRSRRGAAAAALYHRRCGPHPLPPADQQGADLQRPPQPFLSARRHGRL